MEWLPIESPPKDGRGILAWNREWNTQQIVFWRDGHWNLPIRRIGFLTVPNPTYWMLPPEPPPF